MSSTYTAIIDGTLFDSLIRLKSLMSGFDDALDNVQFIHMDRLQEAIENGELVSTRISFFLFGALSADEYTDARDKISQFKKNNNIQTCIILFAAPMHHVLAKTITHVGDLDMLMSDVIWTIHITHEKNESKESLPLKFISLISALSEYQEASFDADYFYAVVKINNDNIGRAVLFSCKQIASHVKRINGQIENCTEEIESLKVRKEHKYECMFSEQLISDSGFTFEKMPREVNALVEYCKSMSGKTAKYIECIDRQTNADVSVAQHTVSKIVDRVSENGEPKTVDVVFDSAFDDKEMPPKSVELIERKIPVMMPGNSLPLFSQLIPFYRCIKEKYSFKLGTVLKTILFTLISLLVFAGIIYGIATYEVYKNNNLTDSYFYNVVPIILALMLAFIIAFVMEIFYKKRLKRYAKYIVGLYSQFFSGTKNMLHNVRQYINKYVTVAINSIIKSKRIDTLLHRMEELGKNKLKHQEQFEVLKQFSQKNGIIIKYDQDETDTDNLESFFIETKETIKKHASTDTSKSDINKNYSRDSLWLSQLFFQMEMDV